MTTPTAADFKAQFVGDFPYGSRRNQVRDADITLAITMAGVNFGTGKWQNDAEAAMVWLFSAAHFLVQRMKARGGPSYGPGGGLNSSGGGFVTAKTVGPVSLTIGQSERFQKSATFSGFLDTEYGRVYLAFLAPKLIGGGFVIPGSGTPPQPII